MEKLNILILNRKNAHYGEKLYTLVENVLFGDEHHGTDSQKLTIFGTVIIPKYERNFNLYKKYCSDSVKQRWEKIQDGMKIFLCFV